MGRKKVSGFAEAAYAEDVALRASFDDLLADARAAENKFRKAQAAAAPNDELYSLARKFDAALTAVMQAAYAAARVEIGPRGYDDRICRRKAKAKPAVRAWTDEAERLLTLRETHRITGIPPPPPPRPLLSGQTGPDPGSIGGHMEHQSETDETVYDTPQGYGGGFWLSTRPIWSIGILIGVGVISAITYPRSGLQGYYTTAASVIVTLYVAMAVTGLIGGAQPRVSVRPVRFEHWIFLIASSAGLLAALRGLSIGKTMAPWLTGLTVVGITATLLLIADHIVAWRGGRAAILWSPLFIAVTVTLILLPWRAGH